MAESHVHNLIAQYEWQQKGILETVQAALTTNKSAATVNALTATGIIVVPSDDGSVALDVRFRGTATALDSNTLVLYGMRNDDDHYTRMGTLTLTTGTQIYSTGVLFVDTITIANEKWVDEIVVVSDADNGIAHISFNTHGFSHFLFIATTLNSTSVIVDTARE